MINNDFWRNKRVFITGHTGFKGSWLAIWLKKLGANVSGYSLAPVTDPSLYELVQLDKKIDANYLDDINNFAHLNRALKESDAEIVFHLAAQSLVRESYVNPLNTFQTNIMGTANVLEACRELPSLKSVVIITTDKCYDNKEWTWSYRENDQLGGFDPYSSSKACAEHVVNAYRNSYFNNEKNLIGVATARAGNVIGGGDFSKDRLIPDFIRAIVQNQAIQLRFPNAIRPWQHVLEPLYGYILLAEKLWQNPQEFSQAWNFGPHLHDTKSVSSVIDMLIALFKRGEWSGDINNHPHEANCLKLDIQKADTYLGWQPKLALKEALSLVKDWYEHWMAYDNVIEPTLKQIDYFTGRFKA